jgi:hypothetical protein
MEPMRLADADTGGSLSQNKGYMPKGWGQSMRRTPMKLATFAAISLVTLAVAGPASAAPYDDGTPTDESPILAPMAQPFYRSAFNDQFVKIGGPGGWVAPPTVPDGQRIPAFVGPTPEGGSPQ